MTKTLLLSAVALSLAISTGCLFSRKAKTKETDAIAAEVEANFRKRWLDKRAAELTTQGQPAVNAQAQAEAEFRERYGFIQSAKK